MKSLIINKQDWALAKNQFCEKFGVSEDEYKNLIKQREEYRKGGSPLPNPVGCTIHDDGHITFNIASECRTKEQACACPINTVKARLDSNGYGYVEYTSNNNYVRNALAWLSFFVIVLEAFRKIMLIFKGK